MIENHANREPFIIFEVAGVTYALPSHQIQQMEMIGEITPVPSAPPFVAGIVFLRGLVVPAIDLRARFGLDRIPYSPRTRLIVVNTHGRTVGLIADSAREFVTIDGDAIRPPPASVTGLSGSYLQGVTTLGDRLVLFMDADKVIDPQENLDGQSETQS